MNQYLLIDADDTLWENNIYFEAAFDRFYEYLDHSSLTPEQVRAALDEIELVRIRSHGYGARNFAQNCVSCYEALVEREIAPEDTECILALADEIMRQPIELLPGVQPTLAELAARNSLTLVTKGQPDEQQMKVDGSGLAGYFQHIEIVREKDAATYSRLVVEHSLPKESTWMIGNSPKSDINPALAAGLNAVFVPHSRTWHLEKSELHFGTGQLLTVNAFSDLLQIF